MAFSRKFRELRAEKAREVRAGSKHPVLSAIATEMAHLSEEEKRRAAAEWFAAMIGGHLQPDVTRHAAMHRSPTTDYIILLAGEITLILDKEERTLKPFDCVVQRGTNHAWVNRGKENALLMAVLVSDGTE